jgi:predicted ATPase
MGSTVNRLVGRQQELARLTDLLAGEAALITLWGPGGAGKTAMLHHLGEARGVFCDLTEARTEADIIQSLGVVLALERGDYRELSDGDALLEVLRQRASTLFLLDNFEQVVHLARDTVGRWIDRCAQHRFIVASREPLGLRDEAVVEIGPLLEADAVSLFARAARSFRPLDLRSARARDTVRRIVARLDGLPLAIELAAARLVLLDLDDLLERLDRQLRVLRSPRRTPQRTVEETVRWSWDLLTRAEQRALAVCSVFRRSFSREAAEALIELDAREAGEPPEPSGLDLLQSLRMKSLVHPVGATARLRMFEAVREFAAQRLGARAADAERRHAEVTLEVAEPGSRALDELALESENLLAIHVRFERSEPALAARAALALHPLLLLRGPFETHQAVFDALLESQTGCAGLPGLLEGRLRVARGEVLRVRGELAHARADLERGRRLSRRNGDRATELQAIRLLGAVTRMQGRVPEALRLLRQGLRRAREADDEQMIAVCLGELGTTLAARGRLRDAAAHHRMALDGHRRRGNRALEGIQLSHLGVATHRLGDAAEARRLHEAALTIHRELGNRRYEAADLSHLAFVHHQLNNLENGRRLYREALALCRAVCDRRLAAIVQCYLADLETDAGEVVRARELLREALGFHEQAGDRPQQAVAWLHLGYNLGRDEPDQAMAALEDALSLSAREQLWVRVSGRAHLAALRDLAGDGAPATTRGGLRRLENRFQRLAVRLLVNRGVPDGDQPAVEAASRVSSDVRRALRWIRCGRSPELVVGKGCSWFSLGQGRVDLSRRGPTRRILAALVAARLDRPGVGIPWHGLFEAGWPGQTIKPEARLQRVYTAVWTLRRMGLEGLLLCHDDGYLLDSTVSIGRHGRFEEV